MNKKELRNKLSEADQLDNSYYDHRVIHHFNYNLEKYCSKDLTNPNKPLLVFNIEKIKKDRWNIPNEIKDLRILIGSWSIEYVYQCSLSGIDAFGNLLQLLIRDYESRNSRK